MSHLPKLKLPALIHKHNVGKKKLAIVVEQKLNEIIAKQANIKNMKRKNLE